MFQTNGLNGHESSTPNPPQNVSPHAMNDAAAVPALLQEISAMGAKIDGNADKATRFAFLDKLQQLRVAVEAPQDTMLRQFWAEPAAVAALTAGSATGIWEHLAETDGPFNLVEVAKIKNCDPALLGRFMRHLAGMGYLKELEQDTFERTNFTKAMAIPSIGQAYPVVSATSLSVLCRFHEYASKAGWKNPLDTTDGPFQFVLGTKQNFFEYVNDRPPYGPQFNNFMSGHHQGRPSWVDDGFYPVQERLVDGCDKSEGSAFLVDIGGGKGHDIEEFRRKHPNASGRLILQDTAVVIDEIEKLDERIEPMAYDFFTEQPIKGARAYYIHHVLHDWVDDTCVQILHRVKDAMKPGYSRLLIHENVVPDVGAHWETTGLDLVVMTVGARARTRSDWETLFSKAGFKIAKIYTAGNAAESIIECDLA